MQAKDNIVIGIDFDGTCVTHTFPEIGEDIGAVPVLKKLVEAGHRLILFTMRCDDQREQVINGYKFRGGDFLTQAVDWFKQNNIPLFGIQENPTQHQWTTSPKAYCNLYIDDAALGIPLVKPEGQRPYEEWVKVEEMLKKKGSM